MLAPTGAWILDPRSLYMLEGLHLFEITVNKKHILNAGTNMGDFVQCRSTTESQAR